MVLGPEDKDVKLLSNTEDLSALRMVAVLVTALSLFRFCAMGAKCKGLDVCHWFVGQMLAGAF